MTLFLWLHPQLGQPLFLIKVFEVLQRKELQQHETASPEKPVSCSRFSQKSYLDKKEEVQTRWKWKLF